MRQVGYIEGICNIKILRIILDKNLKHGNYVLWKFDLARRVILKWI